MNPGDDDYVAPSMADAKAREELARQPIGRDDPYDNMCNKPYMMAYYIGLCFHFSVAVFLVNSSFKGGYEYSNRPLVKAMRSMFIIGCCCMIMEAFPILEDEDDMKPEDKPKPGVYYDRAFFWAYLNAVTYGVYNFIGISLALKIYSDHVDDDNWMPIFREIGISYILYLLCHILGYQLIKIMDAHHPHNVRLKAIGSALMMQVAREPRAASPVLVAAASSERVRRNSAPNGGRNAPLLDAPVAAVLVPPSASLLVRSKQSADDRNAPPPAETDAPVPVAIAIDPYTRNQVNNNMIVPVAIAVDSSSAAGAGGVPYALPVPASGYGHNSNVPPPSYDEAMNR